MGGGIALSACSNGNNEDDEKPPVEDKKPEASGAIVARMTTVNSELTFYENGTVEFKEDNAAKSASSRAVTTAAESSLGTYSGNVTQDKAEISLTFAYGKRKGKGTAKIAERDDASNISINVGDEELKLERIQTIVTAWRTDSSKKLYFYNDKRAMQVIKDGDSTTCHPLIYTGDADKDGDVKIAFLDDNKEHKDYKSANISGNTMTYGEETYTKIDDDRSLVTAWRATTDNKNGIRFIETMYFYDDATFMIVMNKKENDQITNGFAGTYTGDTTKDEETASAIIAGLGTLPGKIADKKLTVTNPEGITTYDRID